METDILANSDSKYVNGIATKMCGWYCNIKHVIVNIVYIEGIKVHLTKKILVGFDHKSKEGLVFIPPLIAIKQAMTALQGMADDKVYLRSHHPQRVKIFEYLIELSLIMSTAKLNNFIAQNMAKLLESSR